MRQRLITIRVDDAEHATFKAAAARVGASMSVYARDAMMARIALEPKVHPPTPAPVAAPRTSSEWQPGDPTIPKHREKLCRHHLADCRICMTGRYA